MANIMVEKDVQNYLNQGMYGTPKVKPDEQNKYLGCFRERIYLSMTFMEIKKTNAEHALLQEIKQHSNGQILLNGAIDNDDLDYFMTIAMKYQVKFEIIHDAQQVNNNNTEKIALLYITDHAVNEPEISLTKKYPIIEATTTKIKDRKPKFETPLQKLIKRKK